MLLRVNVILEVVSNNPQEHWIFPLLKCIVMQKTLSVAILFKMNPWTRKISNIWELIKSVNS